MINRENLRTNEEGWSQVKKYKPTEQRFVIRTCSKVMKLDEVNESV